MNLRSLYILALAFSLQSMAFGQVSLLAGLRYQLDQFNHIKDYPTSDIKENFGVHLVPHLEFEYQAHFFVAQLGIGYYRGGNTLSNYTGSGAHAMWNPPPHYLHSINSSYIHEYSHIATRVAISCRITPSPWLNLDLGVFYASDFLINEKLSEYSTVKTNYTLAYTDTGGTYHPETVTSVTTSDGPLRLASFAYKTSYAGIRIAPQFRIKSQYTIGIEFNIKFQWQERSTDLISTQDLTHFDRVALDYALRIGYTFREKQ